MTHNFTYFKNHSSEVCNVKFSPDSSLILTGGNDHKFNIFSQKTKHSLFSEKHEGAVRGLAWSHFQYQTFFTGGGRDDAKLK